MRARLRRGVEHHPLLWWALLAVAAVLWGDGFQAGGGLMLAVTAALMAWAGKWRMLGGGMVVAVLAGGLHYERVNRQRANEAWVGEGRFGEVVARVVAEPRVLGAGWSAEAELDEPRGRVNLSGRGAAPRRGTLLAAAGSFQPLQGMRNPGEFDTRQWLRRQGVFAEFRAEGAPRMVAEVPLWSTAGDGVKAGFREAVTRGLDPQSREASVIRAVVLGEHPGDDMLIEPFRRSGTLHLFAVSGLHVGMVAALGWLFLKLIGVPRRTAVLLLVGLVFFYAWLTGMKPPATRAAWMATVLLGAFWFRRRPNVANALGLAALMLVFSNGNGVFKAGVQLSFGVVAAIGLLSRLVAKGLAPLEAREEYLPLALYGRWRMGWLNLRRWLVGSLSVSASAWLGSAPLTAFYFGLLTPVSVVTSVALTLVVFPLLGLALVSAALSPLPRVSGWLNGANAGLARTVFRVAELGAAVPWGNAALARGRPAEDFLVVYDLGDGGAACLHDAGATMLFDAGDRRGFERVLLPSLRRMALRPQAVLLSHPDGGHVGGVVPALDAFPIRQGVVPVLRARGTNFRDLLSAAEARAIPLRRGRTGFHYSVSETARFEVMNEPDPWRWSNEADERVMVARLEWRGWRVLFVSDAGWTTERALLNSGRNLAADVVVAGRHARDTALGRPFLEAVGPRAIVAGHADFPTQEAVPESWRTACEARGIRVFHQGECGAVILSVEDGVLVIRGFLGGKELRLER